MPIIPSPPLRLPSRDVKQHKGDFGRALLVGGSLGLTGAISLSALACLRSGAGLVTVGTPDCCLPIVASFHPSYMTLPLAETPDGKLGKLSLKELCGPMDRADVLAWGPGLGRTADTTYVTRQVATDFPRTMVIDADGLFALPVGLESLEHFPAERILTPHHGELERLVGTDLGSRQAAEEAAHGLAQEGNCIVVLKGHRTFVTDGDRTYRNTTGNPGMATGGTGDVLTGIITGLLCQKLTPFDAARLGVFVHGLAGDFAAEKLGQLSLVATDLIDFLPTAFESIAT